jgi:hypothetical protein
LVFIGHKEGTFTNAFTPGFLGRHSAPVSVSNSERAGSHIGIVKALECTELYRGAFNSLVFDAFNSAPVQELNTQKLVSKWKSGGHMSGAAAGSTEEGKSKVLKRHLETKYPCFLLSKEAALADCIRRNERAFDI